MDMQQASNTRIDLSTGQWATVSYTLPDGRNVVADAYRGLCGAYLSEAQEDALTELACRVALENHEPMLTDDEINAAF